MICAIYCRLSKEDLKEDGKMEVKESESIQNQKSLLLNYALDAGWQVYQIYCDEDYSGIDRERPEFKQLLLDAEAKLFDIILCKTQSRFTRDMELVESYIHHKFLLWGIRFVTVVDHIDTQIQGSKKTRQINGLINQWYLEDLSDNIRAIFDHKRKQGKFIGSFACYGYQKDPQDHNKLLIDQEAAPNIEKIFKLYRQGYGKQQISRALNEEGLPNPTKYKQLKGSSYVNSDGASSRGFWNKTTVGRILKNPMYMGTMVQGIRKKLSYKSAQIAPVPPQQWYVVPQTHPAIISPEVFSLVQSMLAGRTKQSRPGMVHPLAGKVRCLLCNSAMVKTSSTYKGVTKAYLRCKLHTQNKALCPNGSVNLAELVEQIAKSVWQLIAAYYEWPDAELFVRLNQVKMGSSKEQQVLKNQIAQRAQALKTLYLDRAGGVIDEAQFLELNTGFLAEKAGLEQRLHYLEAEEDAYRQSQAGPGGSLEERLRKMQELQEVDSELIALLIDFIQIGSKDSATGEQKLIIHWQI